MSHRVETLLVELRYRSSRAALDGHGMQERLARFLRTEGLRRIEARFDRHDPAGQVWRVDRLEIDLGRLTHRQDEHQWTARLDDALDVALLRASQDRPSAGLPSARWHAVDQFLFYLVNGHLPWGLSLPGRHAVAHWLQRLAQTHGRRLWTVLQSHPERQRMLDRLTQVSPHHGLHALLAQRDAPLATALQGFDEACLQPLQAHGWISTHQLRQLQQELRAAGLRALWGARGSALGGTRRVRLLDALRQALARHVGPAWALRLAVLRDGASKSAPATALLQDLIASPASYPMLAGEPQAADAQPPGRTWEAGLQQLREALSHPRRHSASHSARVATLLLRLAAGHRSALRNHLLQWADERRHRRLWSQFVAPANLDLLIQAMSPADAANAGLAGATPWSDSLRQTAMRLQREAPADHRPGLGRLQALLMEACLQRLAEGHRLPDSHSAWQALWQGAWARWQGEEQAGGEWPRPAAGPRRPEPPQTPQTSRREPDRPPAALSSVDQALRQLDRQCREGRWDWPQRLRLARLLETDAACQRWLQLFDESRRWQMLRAQFGSAAAALQRRAGRLRQWLAGVIAEPAALVREHWRRLCRYLFVQGLSPDEASLRSHYQAQPVPNVAGTASHTALNEPIWVRDAGQVLLVAYAERLFKQLRLVDQGRFVDASAQAQAVQCLQTLCHGPGPVDEAQTVLSRLLCGVMPAGLLPPAPALPDDTTALLDQLLQAVIAHWKAIGHASVAGLRECFLQREGRLLRDRTPAGEPPRWRLRVQTRGIDVLLDRLPWSFQTIRLPWMQGALHVQWR